MKSPFPWRVQAPTEVPTAEAHLPSGAYKEAAITSADGHPVRRAQEPHGDIDVMDMTAQRGVQGIEAITMTWKRWHLVTAYIFIWIIYFVDAMQSGLSSALVPYVYSDFQQHSLISTAGIFSSLIGGVFKLPLAKILDVWGRPQGFILMVFILTVGIVMMAACDNVETYAAAQVFYWTGYNGISYCISIFIADTSHLKNRALMFGYISSPYIITVWISSPIAESVLGGIGWRWGYGVFAIVTPVMCLPLWGLFAWNYQQAKKSGVLAGRHSGRSLKQSLKYYLVEFDVVGLILICGGFSLFLLPFSIYSLQTYGWRDGLIIGLLVGGIATLILFVLYETLVAPKTFLPWQMLRDRTVLGSCILGCVIFVEFYLWDVYFNSFLQVVAELSITQAGYVTNIYSIGSCFWSILVGLAVRYTGKFKWIALYFGVPVTTLGVGLMIHFRQPGVHIGYMVLCQILIAIAGGSCVIAIEMAAMAAVSHQMVAVVLAVQSMITNVGGAIGQTAAAAIWTNVVPRKLALYLPADQQANLSAIYGDLSVQLSYPSGSPTRLAIQAAYGDAMRDMLIGGTAVMALALAAVLMWRDINVKTFKQVKGLVV